MMAAGMAVRLSGWLAVVLLLVIHAMVMQLRGSFMMVLRTVVHAVPCRNIRAARRRRKCRQTLQRQGQQQQPDGNQSQMFHGWQFKGFLWVLQ